MSIAWDETLALGDPAIDADHRRMMALIARLEDSAAAEDCPGHVAGTLAELSALCRDHFAREEAFQSRIGYPDQDGHRLAHQMLLKRLDAIISHYAGSDADIRLGIIRTLGDSLATWLISHITDSDMDYKRYMAEAS